MIEDPEAWEACDPEDLWVFDKLIFSRLQGYTCGPVGVDVPHPGNYIVRPCVNLLGMGRGAQEVYIEDETDHFPEGHFWCEKFEGIHLSIDYENGIQTLAVQGIRLSDDPLWRWIAWKKVNDKISYPLDTVYPILNVEFIGDKIIEVHFRPNPDSKYFKYVYDTILPVWEGGSVEPMKDWTFVKDEEYKRLGFFIKLE